jgi:hypothetical protein
MDRVTDLVSILRREVADYAGEATNARMTYFENLEQQEFAILVIPDDWHERAYVGLLARIDADKIIIERDMNSKPLYDELLRDNIPDDNIILAYQGQKIE